MSLKVLHLASFNGNIGDNANHSGFRPWIEKLSGQSMEWTDLEIREFYWKERAFDASFVQLANTFDLVVIGGGNYFELWVDKSHTGTSIDIPLDLFAQIKPPVFFNALGCDAGQGVTDNSISRFNKFLDLIVHSPKCLVTVRNDGAKKTMQRYVPTALSDKVTTIPDGGFFLEAADVQAPYLKPSSKRVGINLACDMAEVRFKNFGDANGYENFCTEFAQMLGDLAKRDPEVQFLFFPHIYSDVKIIWDVLAKMGDRLRRTRVACAPYVNGAEGAKQLFGLYKQCHLMLATRFHANVCSFGLGIPVIGLGNYSQIDLLYEELNYPQGCFDVRNPGFSIALSQTILSSLERKASNEGKLIMSDIENARKSFEPVLSQWLHRNNLKGKS